MGSARRGSARPSDGAWVLIVDFPFGMVPSIPRGFASPSVTHTIAAEAISTRHHRLAPGWSGRPRTAVSPHTAGRPSGAKRRFVGLVGEPLRAGLHPAEMVAALEALAQDFCTGGGMNCASPCNHAVRGLRTDLSRRAKVCSRLRFHALACRTWKHGLSSVWARWPPAGSPISSNWVLGGNDRLVQQHLV